jgi:glycosyltransferase involved in cell wall biosynthesis
MKIAYIVPGSGGSFYCGNCLRDSDYSNALKKTGHDVSIIPMYLPISYDTCEADAPIFYGAVNLYLKQWSPIFKYMPKFIQKFFDSEFMLKFAAKKSGSTDPTGLEDMTISMLKGKDGKQADDLELLMNWLRDHEKPDVIHLSNALLSGLAERLKTELNCAIVCSLQDEDEWVDAMREPYLSESWKLIEDNSQFIDAYISVSHYYKELIQKRIKIPEEKLHVVHNSICKDTFTEKQTPEHHTIGYMSKINSDFGADILFDAFTILKKDDRFKKLKLKFTGGYTDDWKKVVRPIQSKIKKLNLHSDVEFFDDLSSKGKHEFLDSISLFCVPSRRKEAFGIHLLEAFAAQLPAVMPNHGAYPEIFKGNKAGLLYEPNTPEALADKLKEILLDKTKYEDLKSNCHTVITESYNNQKQVDKILEIYKSSVL